MDELQIIQSKIYVIRGLRVMLDFDLAILYEVETRSLNQTVKRNARRFPNDFMFQLTEQEWILISSQFVTTSWLIRTTLTRIPACSWTPSVSPLLNFRPNQPRPSLANPSASSNQKRTMRRIKRKRNNTNPS